MEIEMLPGKLDILLEPKMIETYTAVAKMLKP